MSNIVLKEQLKSMPKVSEASRGRLVFAMDATASREQTWSKAIVEQARMLSAVKGVQVQLVYFGADSCRHSPWMSDSTKLARMMETVRCRAGITQLGRVFDHLFSENQKHPVASMMFVGDAFEESLAKVAVQAHHIGVPCFMFQEGNDVTVENAYMEIADASGGAYARFGNRKEMGDLMTLVGQYAAGQLSKPEAPRSGAPTYLLPKA